MKADPCDARPGFEKCGASLRNGAPCRYRAKSHHPDHGPLCGVHMRSTQNAHECSICLEAAKRRQQTRGLPCGHRFHGRCIAAWFRRGSLTCPLCRAPAFGTSVPLSARVLAYFRYKLRMSAQGMGYLLPYIVNSVGFVRDTAVNASELSLLQWTAYDTRSVRDFVQLLRQYETPAA